METERLEKILRQWLPGKEPIIIEEIHSGISSHARKIMCGKTQGIFREIASEAQAKTEAEFTAVLAPQGIAPGLKLTKTQATYVQDQGQFYNFQEYLQLSPGKPRGVELAAHVGKTVARMQKVLFHKRMTLPVVPDRFALGQLKQKAQCRIAWFPTAVTAEHQAAIQRLLQDSLIINLREDQPIHGDLGLWNMLWITSGLRIIDFGEARLGDGYFDLAASLSSCIQNEPDHVLYPLMIEAFLNSYGDTYQAIDQPKLWAAIRFWLLRGVLAVISFQTPESWDALITTYLDLISELNIIFNP